MALEKSLEKFCNTGKSIVPRTSSAIAMKRIIYIHALFNSPFF